MTGPRDNRGGSPVDSETFQEWVEHTADSRGVDEQELLNQLVSAFWILDEMNGVAGDSTDTPSLGNGDGQTGTPDRTDTDPEPKRLGGSGTTEEPDPETDPQRDDGTAPEGDVAEEIRALRESVHARLEVVQAVGELRRQVSDLSLDLEDQRSKQEQFTDRIGDDLTRLHRRIETLESETAGAPDEDAVTHATEAAVDRVLAELGPEIERLDASHEEFEAWIETEFDEIEGLFEHVLETTSELESRMDELESEIESIRGQTSEHDRLVSLRHDAHDAGVSTGNCASCETTVDLSMLDSPTCPTCESTFTGVEPSEGWNPFTKATLRTDSEPPTPPEKFE